MKAINFWEYMFTGTSIRYLQDVRGGHAIHWSGCVIDNIDSLMRDIKDFVLPVTQRATYPLQDFRDKMKEKTKDSKLTEKEADELSKIVSDLRMTLTAEASGKFVFVVTEKRFSVEKLLSNIENLFAPDVFQTLPVIAINDFREAGKCIAFERATAGAFHLLRGTESVLRKYYISKVKRNRTKDITWGSLVNELRGKKGVPPQLINHLDNIRKDYRNPTNHPEMIYDIDGVQDLLGLCIDVVNKMSPDLKSEEIGEVLALGV